MNQKKKHRLPLLVVTLFLLLTAFTFPSIARSDTKIDMVSIVVDEVGTLESGEEVGDVTVSTDSDEFSIETSYFTTKEHVWQAGETPQVCIELYAENGYRFSYTSKSHFSLSGFGAKFKKAKVVDSGDGLLLYIDLKKVSGKPLEVENPYWKRNEARWDKMDDAEKYEVRLYRGSSIIATQTTSRTSYDFTSKMTQKGRYSFRVRSISKYDVTGSWSDYSDDRDVDAEDARRNASLSDSNNNSSSNNQNSGSNYPGNSNTGTNNPVSQSVGWIKDSNGWWYRYSNGSYPRNTWLKVNNKNYYFDGNGYMKTGWQYLSNNWYYLDASGAMLTGWQYINNKWYLLNNNGVMLTGWQYTNNNWYFLESSGVMLTGWQYINNKWYFLNSNGVMLTGWQTINGRRYYMESSGAMLKGWHSLNNKWYFFDATGALVTNTITPDGYRVDANGVMIR